MSKKCRENGQFDRKPILRVRGIEFAACQFLSVRFQRVINLKHPV